MTTTSAGGRLRRAVLGGTLAASGVLIAASVVHAHAMLLSSDPAAGSILPTSPARIRLVFNEAIDPTVSGVTLTGPSGIARALAVQADPRAVSALIAPVDSLGAGGYRVVWRTVSADGHRVDGTFTFTIRDQKPATRGTTAVPIPPPVPVEVSAQRHGPTLFGAPIIASLLRGLGLGFLMALAGLLFFVQRADVDSTGALRLSRWLAVGAVLFLLAHLEVWTMNAAADRSFTVSWMLSMLSTTPGHMELVRLAATALAVWALILARRDLLALMFAAIALVVSGGLGHPAAIHPAVTIPAKAIHLCAGAAWLGGLIWLLIADRSDAGRFVREARRVSRVALVSVILVVFSGLAETFNFLVPPANLFRTTYGAIVLVKMAGLLILVAFGAYHRYRELPAMSDSTSDGRLAGTIRAELAVFVVVLLVGGFLANVSPGEAPSTVAVSLQGSHGP